MQSIHVWEAGQLGLTQESHLHDESQQQIAQAVSRIAADMAGKVSQLGPVEFAIDAEAEDSALKAWSDWAHGASGDETSSRFQACLRLNYSFDSGCESVHLSDLKLSDVPPTRQMPVMSPPLIMREACRRSGLNPWSSLPALRIALPHALASASKQVAKPASWLVQRFFQRLKLELSGMLKGCLPAKDLDDIAGLPPDMDRPDRHASPVQVAKALLRTVRDDVYSRGYKSSNKFRLGKAGFQPEQAGFYWLRSEQAHQAIVELRENYPYNNSQSFNALLNSRGQNCEELSSVASLILASSSYPARCQVAFRGEDHSVLLVGGQLPRLLPGRFLPLSEMPNEWAVCDPWANIASPVDQFEDAYVSKMKKWTQEGKQVFDSFSQSWRQSWTPDLKNRLQQGVASSGNSL